MYGLVWFETVESTVMMVLSFISLKYISFSYFWYGENKVCGGELVVISLDEERNLHTSVCIYLVIMSMVGYLWYKIIIFVNT